MNDIFKNFRWLIISIILGFIISITYNLIKNYYFSSHNIKKINIFEINIDEDVSLYFNKNEIKKYTQKIGDVKKEFGVLNVMDAKEKFERGYTSAQVIYELNTGNIWSITTIDPINPDECLIERDKRYNEFRVNYKILDMNDESLKIENEYRKHKRDEDIYVAYIAYYFKDLPAIARITCYDNREAKVPEGSDGDSFKFLGEIRFELIKNNLFDIYK